MSTSVSPLDQTAAAPGELSALRDQLADELGTVRELVTRPVERRPASYPRCDCCHR